MLTGAPSSYENPSPLPSVPSHQGRGDPLVTLPLDGGGKGEGDKARLFSNQGGDGCDRLLVEGVPANARADLLTEGA